MELVHLSNKDILVVSKTLLPSIYISPEIVFKKTDSFFSLTRRQFD